ncbi:phosphoribosyltransferase [Mycoplasma sp. SG1]|uniref:phosphoribosyltransferase n=1 Tax=Mycoplasma sp. SG1 TaxID=2810348 RepID=UPI002024795E|nr:phosphoribosyltransferase family protein [Mycoplasma sp. SG1]URM52815.1 hypothetical protein JRW51_00515 [Mycoplasma sp. SG1]
MEKIELFLTAHDIQKRIKKLAAEINEFLKTTTNPVIFVGVLKGAFIFLADLIRYIDYPIEIDFIQILTTDDDDPMRLKINSSSSSNFKIISDVTVDLKDKTVFLVDEIIDSGLTYKLCTDHILKKHKPKVLKTVVLLNRYQTVDKAVKIDYVGFNIEKGYVIGYGLDYRNRFRYFPYISFYHSDKIEDIKTQHSNNKKSHEMIKSLKI